ncbi:MAG: aminotransferase class III-fold pyridoxal phosphate-dependent enzyme, partial [Thermoplasmata archaeon]|nr:aminotransferase class III-fold pyridoxal phosphate-dependent enzyme [Thermoplasmata archaeon]
FCNSGTEAVESALKFARKYGNRTGRYEIITMLGSFHGRTFGSMTATGQEKYRKKFEPVVPGFRYVPFGDIDALAGEITEKTVAVLVEPIQGEGGVNVASKEYFEGLREICTKKEILLIFDEIQTGLGRTGNWFGYQHVGVEPDAMTLAKTLGGGFPIGALVGCQELGDTFEPGDHASTFGGSALACVAALAVFEAIEEENLVENARVMGEYMLDKLEGLKSKYSFVKEVRGAGLMLGMELEARGPEVVKKCLEDKLIINCTAGNVIRFLPAMTVGEAEIDAGLKVLEAALQAQ